MTFRNITFCLFLSIAGFICATSVSHAQGVYPDDAIIKALEEGKTGGRLRSDIKSGKVSPGKLAGFAKRLSKEGRLQPTPLRFFLLTLSDLLVKNQFASYAGAVVKASMKGLSKADQEKLNESYTLLARAEGIIGFDTKEVPEATALAAIGGINQHNVKLWNKRLKGAKVVETINDGDGNPLSNN